MVEGTPEVVEKIVVATVPPEETHEIGFAWWTGGEGANKVFEEAVDRFELSHPNYTVERMPISAEFTTKILTMYGSGNAPDCHGVPWGTVWSWAHKGVMLELTPLVEADPEFNWDDMWEAVTYQLVYPAGSNTIVALPRETFGMNIQVYNAGLFADFGVDTPDVDYEADNWIWNVWREKANATTSFDDADRRVTMGANFWGLGLWVFQIVMPSLGVDPFNADQTHYNIDDPSMIEWIKMYIAMRNEDRALGTSEETSQFDWGSSGKLALAYSATWEIPNLRQTWADLEWDFLPPPKGECCHTNIVGNDYHVVNGGDYADHEGGWEMIKFLNSPQEDLWWALNMFGPPFRRSNLEAWTSEVGELVPKNGWNYVDAMQAGAVGWTPVPFAEEISTIIGNEMPLSVDGDRSVEETVTIIADQIDEMIANFE
jgi:multiple sugar transport system substrate-binding protein